MGSHFSLLVRFFSPAKMRFSSSLLFKFKARWLENIVRRLVCPSRAYCYREFPTVPLLGSTHLIEKWRSWYCSYQLQELYWEYPWMASQSYNLLHFMVTASLDFRTSTSHISGAPFKFWVNFPWNDRRFPSRENWSRYFSCCETPKWSLFIDCQSQQSCFLPFLILHRRCSSLLIYSTMVDGSWYCSIPWSKTSLSTFVALGFVSGNLVLAPWFVWRRSSLAYWWDQRRAL